MRFYSIHSSAEANSSSSIIVRELMNAVNIAIALEKPLLIKDARDHSSDDSAETVKNFKMNLFTDEIATLILPTNT